MAMCVRYLVLTVLLTSFGRGVWAGEAAIPRNLTPDTFEAIKARVSVTPADLSWQQVRWRAGFLDGLLDAQAADKPLFFWFYGGDPRGNC
jgi:hypothetical protein